MKINELKIFGKLKFESLLSLKMRAVRTSLKHSLFDITLKLYIYREIKNFNFYIHFFPFMNQRR